jgi:GDPmannose 4,6-dehydratase
MAHWATVNFRESYGMHASCGILFNHESPRRGETFVTRKITRAAARIKLGLQDRLHLGNLNAKRDWGHARDYVRAMWLILQHDTPDDYIVATGRQHSVREFVDASFRCAGIELAWEGSGVSEKAVDKRSGEVLVAINPRYFRPTEVDSLLGDATKIEQRLGWQPTITFEQMVEEMVKADLVEAQKEHVMVREGFVETQPREE